jgi:hypothetical protein
MLEKSEGLESIPVAAKKQVPTTVIILSIINYLILGLIIIGLVASLILTSFYTNSGTIGSFGFYMAIVVSVLFIGLFVMAFIGTIKMNRGKKSGFMLYSIGVGFVSLLAILVNFMSITNSSEIMSNLIIAGIGFVFIAIFASQLKHLN